MRADPSAGYDAPMSADLTPSPDESRPAAGEWPAPFLDALRADVGVIGVAEVRPSTPGTRALVVVTTWDARDAVAARLPQLGALALGGEPTASHHTTDRWTGLASDARRIDVEVVRIGDLKPSARGETATVVLDTKDLLDQWVRWSGGRDRSRESARGETPADPVLVVDAAVRMLDALPLGCRTCGDDEPLRPRVATHLRRLRGAVSADAPGGAALLARLDAALAPCPQPGAGLRVVPGDAGPAAALDAFLRVADGEGFLGDRMLFEAAVNRLVELSGRTPDFDEGYLLPSFDGVEGRWRFGEGVGGCRTPLVPGIVVGIGVTPADHLEFWAAPCVRETLCDVACVADPGTRVVRERTAGRDAFLGAMTGEIDRAWDDLPALLRSARRAGRVREDDPDAALRPLHLPRSYREAAKRLSRSPAPTRLALALALCRAGSGEEPIHARKFGLSAGRLLATTPAAPAGSEDDDSCDADACGPGDCAG